MKIAIMKHVVFPLVIMGMTAGGETSRRAQFDPIGIDYVPVTAVTDHLRMSLALDHELIESLMKSGTVNLQLAKLVYEQGYGSLSFAEVTLDDPLSSEILEGSVITGTNFIGDGEVVGSAMETFPAGSQVIRIRYGVPVGQKFVTCRVGGAPEVLRMLDGCFASTGVLSLGGSGGSVMNTQLSYAYNETTDNKNGRTFQSLSLQAKDILQPFLRYQQHLNYYGRHDYADHIMQAGFDIRQTNLVRGNLDFTKFDPKGEEHGEVLRKSVVTLHAGMWVIGAMERALELCQTGCNNSPACYEESVHLWDQAVAYYSGSGPKDKLAFSDADKYCKYYGTCGKDQELVEGTAQVNHKVMEYFRAGQSLLMNGKCEDARVEKEKLENLMAVPNIQGVLRNIWKGHDNHNKGQTNKIEKHRGEAIAYNAAVLPLVYACNPHDATVLHDSIQTGALNLETYKVVKDIFERNYECMGVGCADVGGFTNKGTAYLDFHQPCGIGSDSNNRGKVIGISVGVVGGVAFLMMVVALVLRGKHRSPMDKSGSNSPDTV